MIPECTLVKSDLIREVIDVARTLANMPRNVGREESSLWVMQQIQKVCVVCLDDFSKGDEVISMSCSHIYHEECILRWLERKPTCPMCLIALPMNSC